MLVVETVGRIRREHFVKGKSKSIKQLVRELKVSRNTVRKVLRSGDRSATFDTTLLHPAIIPGGMYVGNPGDVPTLGTRAVLVSTSNHPNEVVYAMVHERHAAVTKPDMGDLDQCRLASDAHTPRPGLTNNEAPARASA